MRIIRKLGRNENDQFSCPNGRNFSRTLRVTSILDLFAKPRLLNKVIRHWMSTHSFLQARIASIDDENYFVYAEQFTDEWMQDDSDIDNVKRLVLDEASSVKLSTDDQEALFNDLSWLICQWGLNKTFEYHKGPLWRIFMMKVNSQDSCEYDLTLVVHHSISEGINCHMILLQLLDLLEYYCSVDVTTVPKHPTVYKPHLSIEELYLDNADRTKCCSRNLKYVARPSYMDPVKASHCLMKPYKWADAMCNDWILETKLDSKEPWYQLGQLISSSEAILFKSRRTTLSKEATERFLKMCKANKCTVTATIASLFAMSIQDIKQLSDPSSATGEHFVTRFPVALRNFKPTLETAAVETSELSMGYLILIMHLTFTNCYTFKPNSTNSFVDFWNYCREKTNEMRQILDNRQFFYHEWSQEREPTECLGTNAFSNLGLLPERLKPRDSLSHQQAFHIKQAYTEISINIIENLNIGSLFCFASTCTGRLN